MSRMSPATQSSKTREESGQRLDEAKVYDLLIPAFSHKAILACLFRARVSMAPQSREKQKGIALHRCARPPAFEGPIPPTNPENQPPQLPTRIPESKCTKCAEGQAGDPTIISDESGALRTSGAVSEINIVADPPSLRFFLRIPRRKASTGPASCSCEARGPDKGLCPVGFGTIGAGADGLDAMDTWSTTPHGGVQIRG